MVLHVGARIVRGQQVSKETGNRILPRRILFRGDDGNARMLQANSNFPLTDDEVHLGLRHESTVDQSNKQLNVCSFRDG